MLVYRALKLMPVDGASDHLEHSLHPLSTMSRHRDIRNLDFEGEHRYARGKAAADQFAAELDDDALSDGGEELTEEQESMS